MTSDTRIRLGDNLEFFVAYDSKGAPATVRIPIEHPDAGEHHLVVTAELVERISRVLCEMRSSTARDLVFVCADHGYYVVEGSHYECPICDEQSARNGREQRNARCTNGRSQRRDPGSATRIDARRNRSRNGDCEDGDGISQRSCRGRARWHASGNNSTLGAFGQTSRVSSGATPSRQTSGSRGAPRIGPAGQRRNSRATGCARL